MEFKSVLSRKPVSEIVASQDSPDRLLSKVLGPCSIAAMGIGAIIGAGIFVLTGTAAALYAGPAIVLSFMLAAIACGLVGLCYAELSAFLPVSGSSYTYTYATLGELAAWVIGWDLILEYAMGGASIVFFAYIGFDAVSNCAQEARRPRRDMPIGILGSLAASTVLYIAVAAVLTGLVPYAELNVADPVAKGVRVIGHEWFSLFIELGALIGLTTVILVLLYGQSRIFAAMANDGLLPPLFARVHLTLRTPYISQLVIGGLVAVVAAVAPIDVLSQLVGVGTLFAC